tara:strand:- start:222 stop:884 length:663 start_codon:yes stop_codon:yes gene_type:complete
MKVLVFDTETTGLPVGRNPSIRETKKWPHIVQLSCILFDTDTNEIIRSYDTVVKVPDNIKISEESISLHGISRDISNTRGLPVKDVLKEFNQMLIASDKVIGHNISFDKRVVMVESIRLYISQYFTIDGARKPEYCTMKNSVDICKIEKVGKDGDKYFKYPSLTELHDKLFQKTPKNVHNSMVDILVCLRCYCKLEHNMDIVEAGCSETKELFKTYSIIQ